MGFALIPLDVRSLLRQFDIRPRKSLGQNFLVDEAALTRVVAAGEVGPDDTVLEIGAGVGSLTRHLASAAARVVAVEIDARLLPALRASLSGFDNVHIVQGDILELRIAKSEMSEPARNSQLVFPNAYKVVANIPYYITSAIVRHLLEAPAKPSLIVLTVQSQVAEHICAGPGDMSLLAVSVQFYGTPRVVAHIPAGAFYPAPDVDSAVVRIDLHRAPPVTTANVDKFFRVVRAGFSQKRKQLKNALAAGLGMKPEAIAARLAAAGIDATRRAETLTLEEWGRVVEARQN